MDATNFVSLKSGTIINLSTVAWIDVDHTPSLGREVPNVVITFAASWSNGDGTYNSLEMPLEGAEAEGFLAALSDRGVDIGHLQKARIRAQHMYRAEPIDEFQSSAEEGESSDERLPGADAGL